MTDEEVAELERVKKVQQAWLHNEDKAYSAAYEQLEIINFDDEKTLAFHQYMKSLADELLGDKTDLDKEGPVFLLSDDKYPNAAFAHDKQGNDFIFVSAGLINMCDNKDQLAFVLGHELEHMLRQKEYGAHFNGKPEEAMADLLSVSKMAEGGYNIEQARVMAEKMFIREQYNVGDEHISDPNRLIMLNMKITEQRDSMKKDGKVSDDITGDKTHDFEPEFLQLVKDRPQTNHPLRQYFAAEDYQNAEPKVKLDLWFEKFYEAAKERPMNGLVHKILQEESHELKISGALEKCPKNDLLCKMLDFSLKENDPNVEALRPFFAVPVYDKNDEVLRPYIHELYKDVLKVERFSPEDGKFINQNHNVESFFVQQGMRDTYFEVTGKNVLNMEYSKADEGKDFPYMDLLDTHDYRAQRVVTLKCQKLENDHYILNDGGHFFEIDEKGKILISEKDEVKFKEKVYAEQINLAVQFFNDMREGKEVKDEYKLYMLDKLWHMSTPGVSETENGKEVLHEKQQVLSQSGYNLKDWHGSNPLSCLGFEYFSKDDKNPKTLSVENIEQYLTPEAKAFWAEKKNYPDESKMPLTTAIKQEFIHSLQDADSWTLLRASDYGLNLNRTFYAPHSERNVDIIRNVHTNKELDCVGYMTAVSAAQLNEHLKSGNDLDDFKFPFAKECSEHRIPDVLNGFANLEMAYEMLKKEPNIYLNYTDKNDNGLLIYLNQPLDKVDEEFKPLIRQRYDDNIAKPENWQESDAWRARGFETKHHTSEAQKFLLNMDVGRSFVFSEQRYPYLDKALEFYTQAGTEDKISYLELLGQSVPGSLDDEPKAKAKEKIWDTIGKDFKNPEIELSERVKMLTMASYYNLFDAKYENYFNTLVGKDGKGGLLKELDEAPSPKLDTYLFLLNSEVRIPDPLIREQVAKKAAEVFVKESGHYNDMTATAEEQNKFIEQVGTLKSCEAMQNVALVDQHTMLEKIADLTLAQAKVCQAIAPNPPKINTCDEKLLMAAYGMEGLVAAIDKGMVKRDTAVAFLLGASHMDAVVQATEQMKNDLDDYFKKDNEAFDRKKYADLYNRVSATEMMKVKKEFDAAPLEVKAAATQLLMKGTQWEKHLETVSERLFCEAGDMAELGKKFLKSYVAARPESERGYYLSAIFVAGANKGDVNFDDKSSPYTPEQRSLARGLRAFLERTSAGTKLAQAIASYPDAPGYIRDEMQLSKNQAKPPARWEVFEWQNKEKKADGNVKTNDVSTYATNDLKLKEESRRDLFSHGKIGKALGSASFFTTYEFKRFDGKDEVVKIEREGAKDLADAEFKVFQEMSAVMSKEFEWMKPLGILIDNAASMVEVENNLRIGEQQLRDAQKLYPDKAKADGVEFCLKVMDWSARGQNWATMEKALGTDYAELEQPYKKAVAKAIFTTELSSMMSGKRFDFDRHAGQYKIDEKTNTIGIFDTGSMSVVEPTTKEKEVLGRVLANTIMALKNDENNSGIGRILSDEIDKGIAQYYAQEISTGKQVPPYLSEFQRGLLALTDFHKEIPPKELAICMVEALNNGTNKLDKAIYQGFVDGIKAQSGAGHDKLEGLTKVMDVALDSKTITTPEARASQKIGRILAAELIKSGDAYEAVTGVSEKLKDHRLWSVLNDECGKIQFAKGVMKEVVSELRPEGYTTAEKKELGHVLYQVLDEGVRLRKMHQDVNVADLFKQQALKTPDSGRYVQNVAKILSLSDSLGVETSLDDFKKAVILGRLADKEVQGGYSDALQKSPSTSFIRKALEKVHPLQFVPRNSTKKIVKTVIKRYAPQCLRAVSRLRQSTKGLMQSKQASRS